MWYVFVWRDSAWGQYFGKKKVSGGGYGSGDCYMETTLNLGLYQRDQMVYYYCDLAGTISDEKRESVIGRAMDWCVALAWQFSFLANTDVCMRFSDFLRSSNDDEADMDAACADLGVAKTAGSLTLIAVVVQFVLLAGRFCSWNNVSIPSLFIVLGCCILQRTSDWVTNSYSQSCANVH